MVNGQRYQFTRGYPEQIPHLTPVHWRDLEWLLSDLEPHVVDLDTPPVRLIRRRMPDRAIALLNVLRDATPGMPISKYRTRSEAEAAVVAMFILSGWEINDILKQFEKHQPGHFMEHAKPEYYLRHTYKRVLTHTANTPNRLQIAQTYQIALHSPWPGRGGALEQRTYLALLAKCWQFSSWTVEASQRELAQHAGASRSGIRAALARLRDAGLVTKKLPWRMDGQIARATTWAVEMRHDDNDEPTGTVTSGDFQGVQEIWSRAHLGRSAGMVWRNLGHDPQTKASLARATGRHRHTVTRALDILRSHGLAQGMRGGWVLGPTDLKTVAEQIGATQTATAQQNLHERQRYAWYKQWRDM
jgi:DNA-binding transcriptional regulator YhcF (GntR family)